MWGFQINRALDLSLIQKGFVLMVYLNYSNSINWNSQKSKTTIRAKPHQLQKSIRIVLIKRLKTRNTPPFEKLVSLKKKQIVDSADFSCVCNLLKQNQERWFQTSKCQANISSPTYKRYMAFDQRKVRGNKMFQYNFCVCTCQKGQKYE